MRATFDIVATHLTRSLSHLTLRRRRRPPSWRWFVFPVSCATVNFNISSYDRILRQLRLFIYTEDGPVY